MTDGDAPEENAAERTEADPDGDGTGPLGELVAMVDAERAASDARAADADRLDELFDRETVAEVDGDRLWARLENRATASERRDADEQERREIRKADYCHRCEHFSAPPTVECTREGTDILEVTALERFLVADCPLVREDESLELERRR